MKFEYEQLWERLVEDDWDAMHAYFLRTGNSLVGIADGAGGTAYFRYSAVLVLAHILLLPPLLILGRVCSERKSSLSIEERLRQQDAAAAALDDLQQQWHSDR